MEDNGEGDSEFACCGAQGQLQIPRSFGFLFCKIGTYHHLVRSEKWQILPFSIWE